MNLWLRASGIDPPTFYTSLKGLRRFWRDYRKIHSLNSSTSHPWILKPNYPCLHDFYAQSGLASGHYFHQDLYVAQKIFRNAPIKHVDVGSRIDGFVAHVASFRALEVFDSRELSPTIPNVTFRQFNLLSIPAQLDACCDSLSCLHVLEHIGLGRYGDPIDLSGHLRALEPGFSRAESPTAVSGRVRGSAGKVRVRGRCAGRNCRQVPGHLWPVDRGRRPGPSAWFGPWDRDQRRCGTPHRVANIPDCRIEWPRVIAESGPILGYAYLLLRLWICWFLLRQVWKALKKGQSLPLFLAAAAGVDLVSGQFGQPTTLGFAVFTAGLSLASIGPTGPASAPPIESSVKRRIRGRSRVAEAIFAAGA